MTELLTRLRGTYPVEEGGIARQVHNRDGHEAAARLEEAAELLADCRKYLGSFGAVEPYGLAGRIDAWFLNYRIEP